MTTQTNSAAGGGIGFGGLLAILFIGLKLTGVIDWSWWWVTAPLWAPLALLLVIAAVMGVVWLVCQAIIFVLDRFERRRRGKR